MRFIGGNIVELSHADMVALAEFTNYSEGRIVASDGTTGNGGSDMPASFPPLDLAAGLRLSVLLHRGVVAAAPVAGMVTSLIHDAIEHSAKIINEGDRERGAAIARRGFAIDEQDALEGIKYLSDLNWVHKRLVELDKAGQLQPLEGHVLDEMSIEDLNRWNEVLTTSLGRVQVRIAEYNKQIAAAGAVVDVAGNGLRVRNDNAINGVEEAIESVRKAKRVMRKAKAKPAARKRK